MRIEDQTSTDIVKAHTRERLVREEQIREETYLKQQIRLKRQKREAWVFTAIIAFAVLMVLAGQLIWSGRP